MIKIFILCCKIGYSQSYALPEDAEQEKISAEVNDGVLKIEIPKVAKEEKKDDVKKIEVK